MSPRWERVAAPPAFQEDGLYMDAVLRPHRSLSAAAFRLMFIAVIAINAALALAFLSQGAFPVAGFLGLDVVALWLAFRWNYRAARIEERVRVGAGQVHVASTDPDGGVTHWALNPIWAQVVRDGKGVLIRAGAIQMRLGAFLAPSECATFASALDGALHRARRGG